ncbi:MAG: flippase-like domain-containing protein, partial [Chloroflexi bacterium]|nr:flippase-like domain-containing protein [Chloroflexota bacterium]
MKTLIRTISVIVAIVLLYFAFRNISFLAVIQAISQSSPWLLLLGLLAGMSEFLVRALRWRYLLSPMRTLSYYKLMKATLIGFAAGNITANAIGSFPRITPLVRDCDVDRDFALGTIGAEIALDLSAIILGALLVSLVSPVSYIVKIGAIGFAAALALAITVLLLFFRRSADVNHFVAGKRVVPDDVKGLRRATLQLLVFARDIVSGMVLSLRHRGVLFRVVPLTIIVWALEKICFE